MVLRSGPEALVRLHILPSLVLGTHGSDRGPATRPAVEMSHVLSVIGQGSWSWPAVLLPLSSRTPSRLRCLVLLRLQ